MKVVCPKCQVPVGADDVNMAKDLAMCPRCQEAFRPSDVVDLDVGGDFADALRDPPSGAWYEDAPRGFVVGASTRSWVALFLVPFATVWTGLGVGVPYGMQIASGEFHPLLSAFGVPFLLGAVVLWAFTLMSVAGKVVVTVDDTEGRVFTGVGPVGWSKPFDWDDVLTIREEVNAFRGQSHGATSILLDGRRRVKFGGGLSLERTHFLVRALEHLRRRGR